MLFSSSIFWLLTSGVFALTLINQKTTRSPHLQNVIFLIASALFYAGWDWRFLGLICFSVFLDYFAALGIGAAASQRTKRFYVSVSLLGNLGLLLFFKYFNFFLGETIDLLNALGFQANPTSLRIILPVGISFYTLQTLSYTIDVYRGTSKPERNLLRYATYVAFFPQLLAGPIERARRMLPQFARFNPITWAGLYQGICLILVGLFLKVVIADSLAPSVNAIFATYDTQNGGVLLLGGIYFVVQLYGDFCGYSTIALGVATLFGIGLSTNFRTPFLANSLSMFWQKWHITLFSFLRDYVYRSLGGSERRLRNILLLFMISGLWHGANWTFIVWGTFNGVVLLMEEWRGTWRKKDKTIMHQATGWFLTQSIFVIGCIIFRSPDLTTAMAYLGSMVSDPSLPNTFRSPFKFVLIALALDLLWRKDVRLSQGVIPQLSGTRWHRISEAGLLALLLLCILISGIAHVDQTAFIYFQF